MKWVKAEDELPAYGEPVLVKLSNIVQHITYCLDGDEEETTVWLEPYFFSDTISYGEKYEIAIPSSKFDQCEWIYISDIE